MLDSTPFHPPPPHQAQVTHGAGVKLLCLQLVLVSLRVDPDARQPADPH
jgi:hypothetical protein